MTKQIASFFFLLLTVAAFAQTDQQKLEKRKAQIQREILENQEKLDKMRSQEKSISSQIEIQKDKIRLKEKLINTTEKQTRLLNDDLYLTQLKINKLKRELVVIREDYAQMILKSYKSRSVQSRAMFLLSSQSFLQAYKRAQYMKQYASYRKAQGEEIKQKTEQLVQYNNTIEVKKAEKQKLLKENEKERRDLLKEKEEQEVLVSSIKKDKKKIAAEIKKKQQESRNIDRQIDRLIQKAIEEANRKAALAAAKASPAKASAVKAKVAESPSKIVLTPEAKIVADNFRSNKGSLPWPVERGVVSLGYGDQPHPVHKSLIVHNSGVEITTEDGANARAVFGGEVISVIVISPVNKAVIIQHGDYFTIYQNLSSVNVSKGDKVRIKQNLGKIRTNGDTGKTTLKFLIKQNTVYNNPQSWLSGM
ncbi:peptidoglycan DD-metalloendopeptidase family protein [Flavobacterium sp. MAH-1]|uniref:Peptidoglycan DD-metalloendopeptidase family protein n=1 Tax=Flavobacterium agri TaxID=2743471 RepID=A0A7Y9C6G5_9FLAO|nr:peptidoglycan DD-metalloendopeptidase family protein [Flavobacterium agri]NUY80177.1 peptidoglycan DD-metalloendopeptidase family protein [Flavobacterium agri]NYA70202.1 peptidoglycan DD-metalloendopeptidase family protein [Flavobacterium agri]